MSKSAQRRDKWHFLRLGARWDRSVVPIYETAARGKCVPLLKTLLTSYCTNECAYCAFRSRRKCPRRVWEPEKLAEITLHLWRERKIRGLFLSSSVQGDPDYITEKQLEVLRHLRAKGYVGYIHLRIMPGTSRYYIREATELADRLGVNLEAPKREIFDEICPDKGGFEEAVLKRLDWIVDEVRRAKREAARPNFGFGKAGVDTQMIVGAAQDSDWEHLQTTEWLYKKFNLRRVYYSGFEPIPDTPLERRTACPLSREYRLYQASFLLRDYGFKADDLAQVMDEKGFLPNTDPKQALVEADLGLFPLDLNSATYYEMLRIPRVGPITARKIIEARRNVKIQFTSDLERILGARFTRRIKRYAELKDKRLTDFHE